MTAEAFDRIVTELMKDNTMTEAYEIAENGHREIFGKRRYKSFDSFRKLRERRINGTKFH